MPQASDRSRYSVAGGKGIISPEELPEEVNAVHAEQHEKAGCVGERMNYEFCAEGQHDEIFTIL